MTAAALPLPFVRAESGAGTVDLLRLALRQHRAQIIGTTLAAAALAAYLSAWRPLLGSSPVNIVSMSNTELMLRYGIIGYTLVVGMFWGAPLLSREYEQRTHLLIWSQDVSPARWLLTKAALLGGIVVVLAVGLDLVDELVYGQIQYGLRGQGWLVEVYLPGFEVNVLVQVGYALAAFTIGLAIGGLTRLPIVAMIVGGLVFTLIRWAVATYLRGLYLSTIDARSFTGVYGDSARELSQLNAGRMVESVIYLGIAALSLTFAWFGVRRRQHI